MDKLSSRPVDLRSIGGKPEDAVWQNWTDAYSASAEEVQEFQLAALRTRFDGMAGKISVLGNLAREQGISKIRQIEDGAALLLRGTELAQCVASRGGARVLSIGADGDGGTVEHELPVTSLAGALPAPGTTPMPNVASVRVDEPYGVSELRALRGGRHRWD